MKQLLSPKSILLFIILSIASIGWMVIGQELPYSSSWSITNSNIQTCNTIRGQQDDYFYMGGKFSGSIDTSAIGVISPDRFNNSVVLATSLTSEAYALKVQKSTGKVDSSIQFAPSGNTETIQSSEIISIGTSTQFQIFAGIINTNQGIFISKFNTNGMEWTQTYLFSSGNYITVRDSKVVDTSIVIVGTYRGDISISNGSIALTSSSSQDYENMFIAILDMTGSIQYIYTNNGNNAKVIPQNLHLSSNGEFCYVMGVFSGSTLSFTKSTSSSEQLTLTSTTSTDQYDLFHLKYSITSKELVWLMGTTGPHQMDYSYKIVGSSPSTIYAFRDIIIDQGYSESSDCGSQTDVPIATLTRNLFTLLSSNVLFGGASATGSQSLSFFKALDFAGFSNSILFDNGTTSSVMNISRSTPLTLSSTGFTTCPNKQALMNYSTEYTLNYASGSETILLKSYVSIPKLLFTSNYNVGVINYAGITSTLTFNMPSTLLSVIDKNLVVDVGGTKRPVKNSNNVYTADLFSTTVGWNNITIYFNNTAQNRYDLISMNSVKTFFFDDSLVISIQNSTILFNSSTLNNGRGTLTLTGLLNSTYNFPQEYVSSIMCRVAQQNFATNIDGNQITCQNVPFSERNTTVVLVYRYSNSIFYNISRSLDLSFIETRTLTTSSQYRVITTDEQTKGSFALSLTIGKTMGSLDVKLQATNQNGAASYLPFTVSSGTSISATLAVAQFEKANLKFMVKSQNDYVDFTNTISIQFLKQVKFTSLSSTIDNSRQMKTAFSIQPNLIDSLKSQLTCQYNESPTLRTALNSTDNTCNIDNRFLSTNNTLQLLLNMGNNVYLQISDSISLTSPSLPTISFLFTPNFGISGFTNITTEITSQDLIFEQLKRNLQIEINSIRYTPTVGSDGKVSFPLVTSVAGWNNLTVLGKYSTNDTSYSVISTQSKIYFFNTPQTNIFTFPNGNITLLTPSSSRNFMIDLVLSSPFDIPYTLLSPNNFFCNIFGESYSAQFVSSTRVQCQNVVSREGETDSFITTSIRNTTFEISSRSLFTFVKTREIKPVGVSLIQSTDFYIGTLPQTQATYSLQINIEDSLFTALQIENTQKLAIQLTDLLTNQKQVRFPQITRGLNMSTLSLNLDVATSQSIFKYEIRVLFKGLEISQVALKYLLVRESPIGKVISSRDSTDNLLINMPRILSTATSISDDEKLIMDRVYCSLGDSTLSKVTYSVSGGIQCKFATDFTSTQTKSVQLFMSINTVATNSSVIKISSNSQQAYPIYCYSIPHYLPTVCSSKGTCKQTDNCTCTNNFQGNDCSFTQCFGIASTDKTVCSGYGQCPTSNNCVCNAGFSGTRCENKVMYVSEDKSWLSTSESMSSLPRSQLSALIETESLSKVECASLLATASIDTIGVDAFCFVNSVDIVIMLNRNVMNNTVLLSSSTIGSILSKSFSQYQVLDTKGKSTSPEILLRTSFSSVNFPAVVEPLIVTASPLSNLGLSWQSDDPTINSQLSSFANQSIIKLNLGAKTRQNVISNGAVNLVLQVADSTFNTLTKYSTKLLLNQSSNSGEAIFNYGGSQIECQSFASCDIAFSVAPIKGSSIRSSFNPDIGNITTNYIHNLKSFAEGCSTVYSLRSSESKQLCIKIRDKGVIQYYLDVNTQQDNSIVVTLSQFNTSSKVYSIITSSNSDIIQLINLNTNTSVQGAKDGSSSAVYFKGIKEQEPYEIRFTSSLGKASLKIQYSTSMQLKLLTFIPKVMGRKSSLILSSLVDSDSSTVQQVDFLLTKKGQSQSTSLPIVQQYNDLTFSQALLNASLLDSGSFYILRVQSRNAKGHVTYIEQSFYVQLEPNYNINCAITPKEGIAYETEFTISCLSNNLDLDTYQFLITNGTHQLELSKGRKRAFFTRIGFLQNAKLQVKTNDVWNSEKTTEFPIQLKHPKQVYQTSLEFYQYLTRKVQDLLNEEVSPNSLGFDYVNSVITFMSILGADSSIVPNYEYRTELGLSLLDIFEKVVGYAKQNKDSTYIGRSLPIMNQFLQQFSNTTQTNRDRVYGLINSTLDILQDFSSTNPSSSINDIFTIVDRIIPLVATDLQTQLFNKLRIVNQQNLFGKMKNGYLVSNFSKLSNTTLENYQIINLNVLGRKISEPINLGTLSLNLPSQISSDSLNSLFEVSALIYQTKSKTSRTLQQATSIPNVQVALTKNSIPLTDSSLNVNITFPIQLNSKTRAQCRSFSFQEEPKNHTTFQSESAVVCLVALSDLNRNLYIYTYEGIFIGPLPQNSDNVKGPLLQDNTLTIALATILSTVGLIFICCSLLVLLFIIGKCRGRGKKENTPNMTEFTYKASGSHSPIGISDHSSSDKNSDTSSEKQQTEKNINQRVTENVELLNGQYQLLETISIHSNYTLYRANNISTGQVVCIKKIGFSSFEEINSSSSVIVKEYTNMSRTQHANIVKLHEVFVDTSLKAVCLALEYFELGNLNELLLKRIQQNQIFDEIHIGQILYQLSQALSYLHDECGLCHRNIRLENIFVRQFTPQKIDICLGEFTDSRSRNSLKIEHDVQDQSFGSAISSYKFGNFTKAVKENAIKSTSDQFTSEDTFQVACVMYKLMSFDMESKVNSLFEEYEFEKDVFTLLESRIHSSYSSEIVSIILSMFAREEKNRPTMNQVTNLLGNVFKFETQ
ncbi:predicted protein [Naegleria gruberi]|uniref:Predicted protein n=1 Tax=Naegleria gruberi TaxID=5762 RepID=D2VEE9_NAEGR|nr:uncharacterized protein NAEGRDRAFT_67254 [Naegleria gruberi]EFC44789.1 predicted protein [Naegleria gruberi]|eukprot:XP_002677533.1 predicted protein [Naegleria gruberi strain NEG-M]